MAIQYNKLTASSGTSWFSCGWDLFKSNAVTWILMLLVFFLLALINIVPMIGSLVFSVITPVITGGVFIAMDKNRSGTPAVVMDVFSGFHDAKVRNNLMILGALGLVILFIISIVFGASMMGMMDMARPGHMQNFNPAMMGSMATAGLMSMLISMLWSMALMFGIPLVALKGAQPIDALKSSIKASFVNWLPLLIFGLISLVLVIVASIPAGLGFIIALPYLICTVYCAFTQIYAEPTNAN